MSDVKLVATLLAGCFVLWMVLHRRRPATVKQESPPPAHREVHLHRQSLSMISPAHQYKEGWPAVAIEMFPPLGDFRVDDYQIIEQVRATYNGPGLPELTLMEDVKDGADVELDSIEDEITSSCPTPRCKAVFAINESVMTRAREGLPPGYDPTPTIVTVQIKMDICGKAERV